MLQSNIINKVVVKTFKWQKYSKEFVNELARLIILYQKQFKIDTPKRLAMFLANVKAEVGTKNGKAIMRENMCYSEKRLKQVFKVFRKNPKLANKYGKNKNHTCNQKMIANIAYANRLGNRDVNSGDGYKYRGAGILQTTGRKTLKKDLKELEKITGMHLINPVTNEVYDNILDYYTIGILLGMAYWYRTKMWKCNNMDCSIDIINKYTDSRNKRKKYYKKILKLIKE